MIGIDEALRIAALRERLFRCVEDELATAPSHKSSEGALTVSLHFPNIFERGEAPAWEIHWYCYLVIEDGRSVSWRGKTLAEALAVAEAAANDICFKYEMARFERRMGIDERIEEEIECSENDYPM